MLKHPILYGPCLDNLTGLRIVFFEFLYKQVFIAARKNIRMQAERSIGRLLSYLIDLHYPNFFVAAKEPSIPARMTILGDIMLRIKLREAPQRPPKNYFSTDLGKVQETLNAAE